MNIIWGVAISFAYTVFVVMAFLWFGRKDGLEFKEWISKWFHKNFQLIKVIIGILALAELTYIAWKI